MKLFQNFKQKSPQQRFLFVLGLIFLGLYIFLGVILFVWKSMPVEISYTRRMILGGILIIYAAIRFVRLQQSQE